jgi:hypothetical protein
MADRCRPQTQDRPAVGTCVRRSGESGESIAACRVFGEAVAERRNRRLAIGRDMLRSPTIRAALLAERPWLDVFCPGCGTSRAIDLRTLHRHPPASVSTLVLGLRCSWRPGSEPMPKLLGLYALAPARGNVIARYRTAPSVVGAPHSVRIEASPRSCACKKPETGDF